MAVIVVAIVGFTVASHNDRTKNPTDSPPSGPVGTGQGGMNQAQFQFPGVVASYDAAKHQAIFTWGAATGPGVTDQYFYAINDQPRVKTSKTTVQVQTSDRQTTCITVWVLLTNGKDLLGDNKCTKS